MTTTQATQTQPDGREGIRQSRVGKRPIPLPKGVTAAVKDGGTVEIKGPKGTLTRALPSSVKVSVANGTVTILPTVVGRDGARFQGLARALLASMVRGVAEGYTK